MKKFTLCFDFDNTIVLTERYPVIVCLRPHVRQVFEMLRARGHYIIISTCRIGKNAEYALRYLSEMKIPFDAFNANNPERVNKYGGDCRKISADFYFDDKAYPLANVDFYDYYRFVLEQEKKYAEDVV